MTPGSNVQDRLRRYLLGQLEDDAREETEKAFLLEDELFEELLIVEDEIIDDYLNAKLSANDRADFEKHFLSTAERAADVNFSQTFQKYLARQTTPAQLLNREKHRAGATSPAVSHEDKQSRWWRSLRFFPPSPLPAAAFALLLVILGFAGWRLFIYQSPLDKSLLALNSAFRQRRPLESRISNLTYARYDVTRGPGEGIDQVELNRAELTLLDAPDMRPRAAYQHGLGRVYLAKKDFDKAIEQFNAALAGDPKNAQVYSDLGAAWLEKGKNADAGKRMESLSLSRGYLDKALELDPNSLEALFNRALCRQQLMLWDDAQNDWQEYLRRDANSPWATEARRNLEDIEERRKAISQTNTELFQSFFKHYQARDDNQAFQIIAGHHARTGNVIVEQLLDDYLDASIRGDQEAATKQLKTLKDIARLASERSGERFFSDLVDYYQSAATHQQLLIVQARTLLKSAYQGWGQAGVEQSLLAFQEARDLFRKAGDVCEAAITEYWISFSYYSQHREDQSSLILQPLSLLSERNGYKWLQVRILYLASAVQFSLNEHSKAIDLASRSLALAEQTSDVVGELNALTSLTEYFRYLGNHQKSLTYIEKSLPLVAAISMEPVQGIRVYGFRATALAAAGHYAVAADYQNEALRRALAIGNVSATSYSYTFLATINGKLGKHELALQNAQSAYDTAAAHSNDESDRELMAYASLQMGHLYQQRKDFAAALSHYNRSLELFEGLGQPSEIYRAHKGKLLCFIGQGDEVQARSQIRLALNLVEKYRKTIFEENNRQSFFQAEQSLYDLAIDFEYSKMKNERESFRLSEMSRGRSLLDLIHADSRVLSNGSELDVVLSNAVSPLTPEQIQKRIPGEAQILQYAVLQDKLIIWVVTRDKISSVAAPTGEAQLKQKVVAFVDLVSSASSDASAIRPLAQELFKTLIAPAAALLEPGKLICVVPDKSLNYLPFQALVAPSGRYLFEDYAIVFSPAATVFIDSCESAREKTQFTNEKILSVGNPAFDKAAYPAFADLPSAAAEARKVSGYYDSRQVLIDQDATARNVKQGMENANVIHLAAHSELDERLPLRSRLLLARTAGDPGESVMAAFEIYRLNLQQARLVVLSACQTGAERYYEGEGMISLVRPFIVERVPLVVASWWPVDSEATRVLMERFHRHRKVEPLTTIEALRRAQTEMLTASDGSYAHPYYWAAFMVVGGYAQF